MLIAPEHVLKFSAMKCFDRKEMYLIASAVQTMMMVKAKFPVIETFLFSSTVRR